MCRPSADSLSLLSEFSNVTWEAALMVTDCIVYYEGKKRYSVYLLFFARSNRFAAEQPPVIDMSRCIEYSAPISSVIW